MLVLALLRDEMTMKSKCFELTQNVYTVTVTPNNNSERRTPRAALETAKDNGMNVFRDKGNILSLELMAVCLLL